MYTKLTSQLTCSVKLMPLPGTPSGSSEMHMFYGKYPVARRKMQEGNFAMKIKFLMI